MYIIYISSSHLLSPLTMYMYRICIWIYVCLASSMCSVSVGEEFLVSNLASFIELYPLVGWICIELLYQLPKLAIL